MSDQNDKMEKLVSLCKRRGFVFPTAEQYGGLQGFWDWGPLGVELKNNIKREWWKRFVQERRDVVGLDSAIITNPMVWDKSGHAEKFADFLLECKKCNSRFKAESILPEEIQNKLVQKAKELMGREQIVTNDGEDPLDQYSETLVPEINKSTECLDCKSHNWARPKYFVMMLKTNVGPILNPKSLAYLRPETAQNIFVNYENVVQMSRKTVPFGIAQIGKAFRNEITPGNFIYRSREFEQMELEYFIDSKQDDRWFHYWVDESMKWFHDLGVKKDHLRKHEQKKEELAHYAKATVDLEYEWPFEKGWAELMGIANRTDFDLKAHGLKAPVPYVIEPSFGVERAALAFLLDAYDEVEGGRTTTTESNKESEVVLRLDKRLAPVKVAVLPLSKKEPLQKVANDIFESMKTSFMCAYDDVASIGRRYRRQDEIGTPFCVTVDFDTLDDKAVTVRDRDTMKQERIALADLKHYIIKQFNGA